MADSRRYSYLPPHTSATPHSAGHRAVVLRRRGVDHGLVVEKSAPPTIDLAAPNAAQHLRERWRAAEPILLRRVLSAELCTLRREVSSTQRLLARVHEGRQSFAAAVWRRAARAPFSPAGVTQDVFDPREIEKVYAHACRGDRRIATDLYAKLSRVALAAGDASLRIRFSFGSEHLLDWTKDRRRARYADQFAEAVFPECRALAGHALLGRCLARLTRRRRVRLSERIVYANAPGGGAAFHHDAEPGQLGVVYGQLAGATAWLALPKRELARAVAEVARSPALVRRAGTPAKALRRLDDHDDAALARLLNESPRFTEHLVAAGAFYLLRAGDVLLLPSPGPDDTAWHSVFAVGRRPSLAHSYGIFAARS